VSGRFHVHPTQNVYSHGIRKEYPFINAYNKRGRSDEMRGHTPNHQPALEEDGDMNVNEEDEELTEHVKLEPERPQSELGRKSSNASGYSDEIPNGQQQINPPQEKMPLDHDENVLGEMTYDQLAEEDFDKVPYPHFVRLPAELQNPQSNIAERMTQCMKFDEVAQNKGEPPILKDFFMQLSKDEWEEAGDWLIDRFADTLKSFKDARRKKRDLVKEYEATVQEREQVVKEKYHAVDLEMARMKDKGMKVIKAGKVK